MKIGYARVSTLGQNLDTQIKALQEAGCELIYSEKVSGVKEHRPELDRCLEKLRKGDFLVVCRLDRLGRSLSGIITLLETLGRSGIGFISIQNNVEISGNNNSLTNKLMTNVIAMFADHERNIIVERLQEGRKVAKEKGVKMGRPLGSSNKSKENACAKLYRAGESLNNIMQILKIASYETIYRYLRNSGIEPNRK